MKQHSRSIAGACVAVALALCSEPAARADEPAIPAPSSGALTPAAPATDEDAYAAAPRKELACAIADRHEAGAYSGDRRAIALAIFYGDACLDHEAPSPARASREKRLARLRSMRADLPAWMPDANEPAARDAKTKPKSPALAGWGYGLLGLSAAMAGASAPFFVLANQSHCELCGYNYIVAVPLAASALMLIPAGALMAATGNRPVPVTFTVTPIAPAAPAAPRSAGLGLTLTGRF